MIEQIEVMIEPKEILSRKGHIVKSIDVKVRTDNEHYGYNKIISNSDIKSFFRQIMEHITDILERELLKEEDNGK